jgi:hypothetical protein
LQPYLRLSDFSYVRVYVVASAPSCPANHREMAESYADVAAYTAAASLRRRLLR